MKNQIKNKLIIALLCLGILGSQITLAYSDTNNQTETEAVSVLTGMGIVDGYSNEILTRAQFCKLAILIENKGDQAAASAYRSLFSDLPSTHWAVGFINLAYSQGLISGYGNGTFGPDDPITVSQAVTMLLRILGYSNSDIGPFWPDDYMTKATKLGLLEGVSVAAGDALTRRDASLMLYNLLYQDTAEGKTYLSTWAASTVEKAVVMDNAADADDGRAATAQIYANGTTIAYYDQANAISADLVGRRGTLLLNKTGRVEGFVPDQNPYKELVVSRISADGITDTGGKTYEITSATAALADGKKTTWGEIWYEATGRGSATLLYSASGSIDLVCLPDTEKYADVLLTGYYENASPNATSPTTITLLGVELTLADGARASVTQFKVGERITVTLNGKGEVASACSATEKRTDLVGILDSVTGETAKVTLTSGLTVSGTLSTSSTTTAALVGGLVKVTSSGLGKVAVSALAGGGTSSKLDVAAKTLGRVSLSGDVAIYDRVGQNNAVKVELSDIALDVVPADSIVYAGTDGGGKVNLLVLEDVTGDCYQYGYLQAGSQSGGSGDMTYTNNTVAVKNSNGTSTAYVTGSTVKNQAAGGVAATADGKTAGVVYLTRADGVARSDFSGTDAVTAGGYLLPISDTVEVYNASTEQWTTLEAAKAFTDSFSVYYDKTPGTGGKVRLIVAG